MNLQMSIMCKSANDFLIRKIFNVRMSQFVAHIS